MSGLRAALLAAIVEFPFRASAHPRNANEILIEADGQTTFERPVHLIIDGGEGYLQRVEEAGGDPVPGRSEEGSALALMVVHLGELFTGDLSGGERIWLRQSGFSLEEQTRRIV